MTFSCTECASPDVIALRPGTEPETAPGVPAAGWCPNEIPQRASLAAHGVHFQPGNRSTIVSNRTTLAQLREMDVTQAASLPTDHLMLLLEDVAAQKADTKRLDDKLNDAMGRRWTEAAAAARRAKDKDTGSVTLDEGEFVIRADLPKKVEWNQPALHNIAEVVRAWGDPLTDYISVKLDVSEAKYNAWPSTIRELFEPARTVGTGKPTFKIERRAA